MLDAFNTPKLAHLPVKTKMGLAIYRWRKKDRSVCAPLTKPLEECTLALGTSGGLFLKGIQIPFDNSVRGGDWTHRFIPKDTPVEALEESHRSQTFDHSGVLSNPCSVLPLHVIRQFEEEGIIGKAADNHVSVMGSITAPGRLVKFTVPEIVRQFKSDGVDAVLLVPV